MSTHTIYSKNRLAKIIQEKAADVFEKVSGHTEITTLEELFLEQLQDLYSAEKQLVDALPKMADAAHSPVLRRGFEVHWAETKEHARRLEIILETYGTRPGGRSCKAMEGLIKEGNETISEKASPEVKDAALIAAAQRVEHYEMAGYGVVRTFASLLGDTRSQALLQKSLDEEGATDRKLIRVAEKLNAEIPRNEEDEACD